MGELIHKSDELVASQINKTDLDGQIAIVVREMELRRAEFKKEWGGSPEDGEADSTNQFPRSAVMRFFYAGKGSGLLSKFITWQFVKRFPKWVFWKR